MSAGVPDEICIFMRTFIGSIGSVAPTRRVPYSSVEFARFPFCCEALARQRGGYPQGTAQIQDWRRNNRRLTRLTIPSRPLSDAARGGR